MSILLLLISLGGLSLLFLKPENLRISLLKSILIFSMCVVGITELLSFFKVLNYNNLVLSWVVINGGLIFLIFKRQSHKTIPTAINKIKSTLINLSNWEKFLVGFSVLIISLVLIQGLIYPSNNWDSMSYHMARIIHWIQNESLSYYRSPVYPQLNSPPFAEQLILNINLLLGNDYFSNSVQLFYLINTGIVISLIAKELKASRLGQILVVFILLCLPEAILLASSTHTELVMSFFMVSSIYYLIRTIKKSSTVYFILLGCSIGLAVCTKNTAYIYLAPFVGFWIAIQLHRSILKEKKLVWFHYAILALVFISINLGHYSRNYQFTGNLFGTNEAIYNYYVNEQHTVGTLISTVSRNLSNQFGVPRVAQTAQQLTENLHDLIGIDVNEPTITSHTYGVDPLATHENNGANFYHTILLLLSSIWIVVFFRKQERRISFFWLAIILSFLLFCFYLKWQPWAKLHVPFFIFYSIILAHFLTKMIKSKIVFTVLILGFVGSATLAILFNWSRPFITLSPFTSKIEINDTRYKKYFSRFLRYHDDYKMVSDQINTHQFKNVGLLFDKYDMEYQLFLGSYRNDIKPVHINSCALSDNIPVSEEIDCIVSTEYEHKIEYQGEAYYNVTKSNDGYLYLFLKK